MTKDALKLAKECGATTYTNRHYPEATAVTFSPLAWETFCEKAFAKLSLPDVLTQEYGDSAQYVEGWNECREVMAGMQAESEADKVIIEYHEATIKRLEAELKARSNT